MSKQSLRAVIVSILVFVLSTLACGKGTIEKLAEVARTPTSMTVSEPTATATTGATATTTAKPKDTTKPASTPTRKADPTPTKEPPTPTLAPELDALTILSKGFGQIARELGYAFVVTNRNAGHAIEDTRYQVAAYNAAGTVVQTDSGRTELLLPGQTLGIAGSMYLDTGVHIDRIEVQISEGDVIASGPIPFFTTGKAVHRSGSFLSNVTGIITSPYSKDITDLRVSAVAYDASGEIIGGGYTYLNFVLANSSTGVEVSVTSAGTVASVELYPMLSALSVLSDSDERPPGAEDLILVKQGFGQDEWSAGFGMVIENPNDDLAVEDTAYHVTAFAADGSVLGVAEGYIEVILPSQVLGIGNDLYLEDDAQVDRIEIQIETGDLETSDPIPPFTTEGVTYRADDLSSMLLGMIVSPYSKDMAQVRVSAILYDASGEIIGGGFSYLDYAPANGKAAVEVSVTSSGAPASWELYATVSSLSDYK